MSDRCHEIGETAGKIYQALEKKGAQDLGNLQKETEIKDTALFNQSLGWLAREAKVQFKKNEKTIEVSLNPSCCAQ